jgi:hypothetical protein
MFAKETTVLVVPAILLLQDSIRSKIIKLVLCLPGLLGYIIFRWVILPTSYGYNYGFSDVTERLFSGDFSGDLGRFIVNGGLAFGVLGLLALHGWSFIRHKKDSALYRLSLLVPVVGIAPFLVGSNVAKVWYLAFPVCIPLSLISLRQLLRAHDL